MTIVGAGGVVIKRWKKSKRFHKEYDKLDVAMRDRVDQKLQDLAQNPRPPGLIFEKLKSCEIYTIHIDGNYKASLEISGSDVFLRRVGTHNEIDRNP